MGGFPTPKESIALHIIFDLLGESPYSREIDDWGAYDKYAFVALNAPKLEIMHADVNRVLREMADKGFAPFEICYFKAGDRNHWYEKFPKSLSRETIRKAWHKSGMRELQIEWRKKMRAKKRSG